MAVSSILSTWSSHCILCAFIYLTITSPAMSLHSSLLYLIRHTPLSTIGPYIFLITFLSKTFVCVCVQYRIFGCWTIAVFVKRLSRKSDNVVVFHLLSTSQYNSSSNHSGHACDLKDRRRYSHLKEEALDRTIWRRLWTCRQTEY